MDRIIAVKVNGNHLTKDNRVAGVRGEANVTHLRITFDEGWDGYAKTVTFYNALGENAVKRTLTADLLEDIVASTRIYLCAIPGEALEEEGLMTFVIDGYADGKRQRSVGTELEVKPAPMADDAGEPADPTPTQAEQLQKQIDTLLYDIQEQAIIADEAAKGSKASEEAAAESASHAEHYATDASGSARAAEASAGAAQASAVSAAESESDAEHYAMGASGFAREAESYAKEAAGSVATAEAKAEQAGSHASASARSAEEAKASADNAKNSEDASALNQANAQSAQELAELHERNAQRYTAEAQESRSAAAVSASAAQQAEAKAKAAQAEAEKARDEAQQFVGGDFATKEYVANAVANASGDIDAGEF